MGKIDNNNQTKAKLASKFYKKIHTFSFGFISDFLSKITITISSTILLTITQWAKSTNDKF